MIELPPFDALALSLYHAPGTQALLVGSGLSRTAGIPTGWEITVDLIRRLAVLDGVTEHDDWPAWFRTKHKKEPNYSELLDALASTQAERRTILHGYIEPPEGDEEARRPTKAHQAIAKLVKSGVVRVIVTTNFDRLIENALRDEGIEPTVIASEDAIAGAEPLVHARCTVIKVHGDYLDSRIKNTDAELAGYAPAIDHLLDQVFDNFGLVVVGWSGEWDTALRSAIERAPSRRYPLYWAARGKLGPLAQDLLEKRGGRHFTITEADGFFVKLADMIEALRLSSRPHPQSVAMAIALARRYCRDDKFAMEWAEFLQVEVEKIKRYVTGPEYPKAELNNDALNGTVTAFVARSEVFRRVCLICGRWGTGEANRAVIAAIKSLDFQMRDRSGYVNLLALRNIGASICFYWNLAGILAREDWFAAGACLQAKLRHDSGEIPFASVLPLMAFESTDWKFLKGLENRTVPGSDFFSEIFRSDANDISIAEDESDYLFDKTEIVVMLEFSHHRIDRVEKSGVWFFMPVGSFIWREHGRQLKETLERISALPDTDPFFKAGLLGGSNAKAAPTLKKIRDFAQEHYSRHLSW
jgi:hypothetical protein